MHRSFVATLLRMTPQCSATHNNEEADCKQRQLEIARIAAIPDDEIDTSDIPELTAEQMQRAVRGPLYQPALLASALPALSEHQRVERARSRTAGLRALSPRRRRK